jgi:predicted phage tail protein
MLIKLHGIFAQDYGSEYSIEADSAGEAIAGLTRQLKFYEDRPLELRPVARAVGFNTPEELFENTEQKEIHLVPAMIGGGGVGRIVVGAALIAFAVSNPFGWAMAAGSLASMAMGAALSVGATLVLSGAMMLFMKAPKASKSSDPDQSQYMSLSDNTVEIGTPIAIQYGRGPATGHVLAVNVDSSDLMLGNFPATTT